MIKVLFVCLGNICRSPMAEAVFNELLRKENLADKIMTDSAGTSDYHIGELADKRTLQLLEEKKLSLHHRARQFSSGDFDDFDYIIAMDKKNKDNMLKLEPVRKSNSSQVFLMREFEDTAGELDVPDPYWSGRDGFLEVHDILWRTCQNLLRHIKKEHQL